MRDQLQAIVDRLIVDYRDRVPPGSVVGCVARATQVVFRDQRYRGRDAAMLVERLARARLDERTAEPSTGMTELASAIRRLEATVSEPGVSRVGAAGVTRADTCG